MGLRGLGRFGISLATLGVAAALLPGVAGAKPGDLLMSDEDAGPGDSGAVLRFDPATGAITPVAQGLPLDNPSGLTYGLDGKIYAVDYSTGPGDTGDVFRVDPITG